MSLRHFTWGQRTGGANADGSSSSPAASSYGPPETFEGTAGAAAVINFSAATKSVTVRNTDDADDLEYSFDGGVTWLGVGATGEITENVSVSSMQIREAAPATNPTYEIVAVLTG